MSRASTARAIARARVRWSRSTRKKFTRVKGARDADALDSWLAERVAGGSCGFAVVENAPAFGARGVVCARPMRAGESIMRVPWTLVLESAATADEDGGWSAGMGMELLERLARGASEPSAPWLATLPRPAPRTPALDFDDDELALIEDERVVEEAMAVRRAYERASERYRERLREIGATVEDLRWATAVVHSRVFVRSDGGVTRRLLVPGVDMCNHDAERYNAVVRVVTSPDTCQGAEATEEIAPPSAERNGSCDKYFELIVDPDGEGISQGEEILISYGNFPNDVFFMYFGFIPRGPNPNDTVRLFDADDLVEDVVQHCASALGVATSNDQIAALRAIFALDSRASIECTLHAVDARLVEACERVLGVSCADVVASRAKYLLSGGRFRTKIKDDVALFKSSDVSQCARLALEFKLRKKEILLAPLGQTLGRYGFDP